MTKSDPNWALWYFNAYVRDHELPKEHVPMAREYFMQGIHAALTESGFLVCKASGDAQRAMSR